MLFIIYKSKTYYNYVKKNQEKIQLNSVEIIEIKGELQYKGYSSNI